MIIILLLNGCVYSGYRELRKRDREKVVFLDPHEDICELKKDEKIYAITGNQLLKCIEAKKNVLVYTWIPYCKGEYCYPLSHVQSYCDSHGLDLYVVVLYYDADRIFIEQNLSQPLFSVNERYYGTKFQKKFIQLFVKDLLENEKSVNEELFNKIWWSNAFVFKDGKLASYHIKMDGV